jgi:dihydrofolate synthase/folylpolyglutamate synthase
LAALEAMRSQLPVTAQAIRNGLAMVELPGRFQIVPGQPAVVFDVAHNPHSVAALSQNLDAMGFFPVTHAVFGAMADKELVPMFEKMAALVDCWYFTDLPIDRACTAEALKTQWTAALNKRKDAVASVHASPMAAFKQAVTRANPTDRIVVFGSFYTVGGVLEHGVPRLNSAHLQT